MNNKEIEAILDHIDFESITKHPNILIAAKFWDEERYHAAKVCYKFMRAIDDLVDDRKAELATFSDEEKQLLTEKVNNWINCLDEFRSVDPFVEEVIDTIARFKIPLKLFHNFSRAMLFDINNNGFSSYNEFIEYSEGASVAPASVFIHLCCLEKKGDEYFPPAFDVADVARPCALFSYIVHIIRDFRKDQYENLNYFATDMLSNNGLNADDLKKIAHGADIPESFRNMIREYMVEAKKYSDETIMQISKLSSKLDTRYMLSLKLIYALYQQVSDRIDPEKGIFTAEELNPTISELKQLVTEIISKEFSD